jgi:thiamine pyrophosphate-dependent acetolactate synthase large subunit-like protein
MSQPITCGQALIQLLERYEVETVFGIPGAHTLELYRGLAGSRIRHVLARHEQGAGFMADGYARASGRPGVCLVITGPGVTNAATPLGQAYADSAPLLLISSVAPRHTLGKGWGYLHEITDQRAVTAPLTALSATALAPEDLPDLIGQAFTIFAAGRPRPVHIAIPTDVLAMPVAGDWLPRRPPARPRPDPEAVQAAAGLLARAARPFIVLGGGAAGPLAELAERLAAPVLATNAGKGRVPDSHPLSLGASICREPARQALARADVVLAVGTELSEADSFVDRLEINGQVIRVDIDPGRMNDRYPAAIGILADAAPAVEALLAALPGGEGSRRAEAEGEAADLRAELLAGLSPLEQGHRRVWSVLREALPANTTLAADATQIAYTGSFAFDVAQPRSWFYPPGYCALGCALPMAIGAALGSPERPAAAVAGDAGFLYTGQELATAVELGLPLPVIVWNNDGLGEIRDGMLARGVPPLAVAPRNPDFVALAEAFGARGRRPAGPDDLGACVAEALAASGPTLIEVRQDSDWLAG